MPRVLRDDFLRWAHRPRPRRERGAVDGPCHFWGRKLALGVRGEGADGEEMMSVGWMEAGPAIDFWFQPVTTRIRSFDLPHALHAGAALGAPTQVGSKISTFFRVRSESQLKPYVTRLGIFTF